MSINVPTNFGGDHLEIFSCDNLIYSGWDISKSWLPTFGNTNVAWTDPETENKDVRYYIISDADEDPDGDGYSSLRELIFETDGNGNGPDEFDYVDSDGDGMHDWYEIKLFGNLLQDGTNDFDGDLLPNNLEMVYNSNTASIVWNSDPSLADTDGDLMDDYLETVTYTFLDPLDASDRDFDQDGLSNAAEHNGTTDLDDWDSDDDSLPDGWEAEWNLNPNLYTDPSSDPEPDGLTHLQEYIYGSNPLSADTDGDGTDDKTEVEQGSSPSNNSDNGQTPVASEIEEVTFGLDGYLSTTDYIMEISGERTVRVLSSVIDATGEWQTHRFRKGKTYTVSISCGSDSSTKKCLARIIDTGGIVLDDPKNIFHLATDVDPANKAKMHFPKITVTASQNEMTLKHDNQCQLSIVTEPSGLDFTDHEFQIKFQDEFDNVYRDLGNGTHMTWKTGVAGKFNLRAKATAGGEETVVSQEVQAEVLFPTRTQILADSGVVLAMQAKWQETLSDSTPTQCREHGFMIHLNTYDDTYYVVHEKTGSWSPPGEGASVVLEYHDDPGRLPNASGNYYQVASFHTHPPETYAPTNTYRHTGPSTPMDNPVNNDTDVAEEWGTPGFVYDYSAPQIQAGHSETNQAHIHEYGPARKELP
jgi:archaellum component FlaF (FlaF/FlaG flagellin family)